MPPQSEIKSSVTNWDIFKFYFPLFTLGSFLFFLYRWYKGYLILSSFPFAAVLQCVIIACVVGLLGSFYKIIARNCLPDSDEDTLLTRAIRYILIGVFFYPAGMIFFIMDGKSGIDNAHMDTIGFLIMWPFLIILIAFVSTLKDWTWGRIPDEQERHESRKLREEALLEARRIEREDL